MRVGPDGRSALGRKVRLVNDAEGRRKAVRLTAIVTVLTPDQPVTIPLAKARQHIPGVGWCGVSPNAKGPVLECTFDRKIAKLVPTIGGQSLRCDYCGDLSYRPVTHQRSTWFLPPDGARTVTIQTYRYHSTVERQVRISAQTLANPTACPVPASSGKPKAA